MAELGVESAAPAALLKGSCALKIINHPNNNDNNNNIEIIIRLLLLIIILIMIIIIMILIITIIIIIIITVLYNDKNDTNNIIRTNINTEGQPRLLQVHDGLLDAERQPVCK